MSITSVARHDATTATLFVGYLAALERDPSQWRWPETTAAYLHHRLDTLAADLLLDGATETVVA